MPCKNPIIQTAERPVLQPPTKIVTQPKIISKVPEIKKSVFQAKSVKHAGYVAPIIKPTGKTTITETVPDNVKQFPHIEHVIT